MFVTKQAIKTQAIKSFPRRLSVFLATAILALNLSPLSAHADDINDMLAAGSYVEGEVIAAILTDGEQMEAESDDAYQVKELISVDSAAVQQAVEDQAAGAAGTDGEIQESIGDSTGNSALNSGYSVKVTTSLSDNINLCVISSDTMSTEELLRELADDPNVVFAEPNYILDLDSDDHSGELTSGGQEGREGQEYPESGQSTPAGLEDPGADEPAPEGQESIEDSESMPKAQEDPEDGEPAPEELYDGEGQQDPENTENSGSTPESRQDPENTENSGSTPEGQQDPEGSELMPGMQEDPEGFGPAVEAPEEEVPEEEVLEDSNKRLGAQPEDGPLNDLTPLQWGNWTNDHTTRAEGAAANPSINVPGC